jgi:hypothetical protein
MARLESFIHRDRIIDRVIKIINNNIGNVGRILMKHSWNVNDDMLIKILNGTFNRYNIIFFPSTSKKSQKIKKYISDAKAWIITDTEKKETKYIVEIRVVKDFSNYFRRFAGNVSKFYKIKENQFLKDLLDLLSHEIVHIKQASKSGKKFVQSQKPEDYSYDDTYLAIPEELDAFAYQAAIEVLRTGKLEGSEVYKRYAKTFEKNDPIFKKFMKRLFKYIETMQ